MIEHKVAQYIADNTSLKLDVDLWAYSLPDGQSEGCFVRMSSEEYSFGSVVSSYVTAFVTYQTYYTCREVADEIRILFGKMKGLGEWATGGDVTVTFLGENESGACLFGITSSIKYEGDN